MPISKAAKKAQRQNIKRHAHNVKIKDELKKTIKEASAKNLSKVYSVVDKAVKRHIIHKNKAARIKSRLSKKFNNKAIGEKTQGTQTVQKNKSNKKNSKKTTKKNTKNKK